MDARTQKCECRGCGGCKKSEWKSSEKCGWVLGKYRHEKDALRCHWCYPFSQDAVTEETTVLPATEVETRQDAGFAAQQQAGSTSSASVGVGDPPEPEPLPASEQANVPTAGCPCADCLNGRRPRTLVECQNMGDEHVYFLHLDYMSRIQ